METDLGFLRGMFLRLLPGLLSNLFSSFCSSRDPLYSSWGRGGVLEGGSRGGTRWGLGELWGREAVGECELLFSVVLLLCFSPYLQTKR